LIIDMRWGWEEYLRDRILEVKSKYFWEDYFPKRKKRYEYRCPYCGYVNVRYEVTVRIVCDRCKKAFYA